MLRILVLLIVALRSNSVFVDSCGNFLRWSFSHTFSRFHLICDCGFGFGLKCVFLSGSGAGTDPLRQGGLQASGLDGAFELDTTVGEKIR